MKLRLEKNSCSLSWTRLLTGFLFFLVYIQLNDKHTLSMFWYISKLYFKQSKMHIEMTKQVLYILVKVHSQLNTYLEMIKFTNTCKTI